MLAKMRPFEYVRPKSLSEAFSIVNQYENGAAVFKAGGTDLFVQMKEQVRTPRCVIDLQDLQELKGITVGKGTVQIGALTRMNEIVKDARLSELGLGVLQEAADKLGSYQIRNRATLGGNVCSASPAADMSTPLLVMEAKVVIEGKSGRRTVPLEDFFLGPGESVLETGELLRYLEVPLPEKGVRAKYIKHGNRRAMTLAVVGIAVKMLLDGPGICREIKTALGAVAPTPFRAYRAEKILTGKEVTEASARQAAEAAAEEASPITDIRGTTEYRKQIIKVKARRLFLELADSRG